MNKKHGAILFCSIVLAISAFVFIGRAKSVKLSQSRGASTSQTITVSGTTSTSENVYYSHVFDHIAFLNRKAADEEGQGRDGKAFRTLYQRQVGLSDAQSRALDEIALNCVRAVARQDERAKRIINQFRARYPGGRVPSGEQLPPPPPELQAMQKERDLIILRARDHLRSTFGEQVFSRFDGFVKKTVKLDGEPTIENLQPSMSPSAIQRLKQRTLP